MRRDDALSETDDVLAEDRRKQSEEKRSDSSSPPAASQPYPHQSDDGCHVTRQTAPQRRSPNTCTSV
ncbi:hypothetical protein EYF80_046709 [Liparis tanakae]|uniref:Uncharacterized protein n=1 Tax=Liparis tanakae TaxID=230148 RepID=A0A4Z2FQE9_9TELE|nr:hypothetical protein EYF80_046709 [Liparis tanakae]